MNSPLYIGTRRVSSTLVNTSNTNTDGTTGTVATVFTAGANGSVVESVLIKGIVPIGSQQAADRVMLWLYDGSTRHPIKEQIVPVGSGNVSLTVPNCEFTVVLNIPMQTGWQLLASTYVGGTTASYHLSAVGGDY
jgi:hypothetical protein